MLRVSLAKTILPGTCHLYPMDVNDSCRQEQKRQESVRAGNRGEDMADEVGKVQNLEKVQGTLHAL